MESVQQREGHPQDTKEGSRSPCLEEEQVFSCSVAMWGDEGGKEGWGLVGTLESGLSVDLFL